MALLLNHIFYTAGYGLPNGSWLPFVLVRRLSEVKEDGCPRPPGYQGRPSVALLLNHTFYKAGYGIPWLVTICAGLEAI